MATLDPSLVTISQLVVDFTVVLAFLVGASTVAVLLSCWGQPSGSSHHPSRF